MKPRSCPKAIGTLSDKMNRRFSRWLNFSENMIANDTGEEQLTMERELARLRQEHRDLDAAILALEEVGRRDQLRVQRLKKRKLILKDQISSLSDRLTPDIIA